MYLMLLDYSSQKAIVVRTIRVTSCLGLVLAVCFDIHGLSVHQERRFILVDQHEAAVLHISAYIFIIHVFYTVYGWDEAMLWLEIQTEVS